nr:nucleotide-binding, alpha-beta plait [Tanacetum cinerariifolium]
MLTSLANVPSISLRCELFRAEIARSTLIPWVILSWIPFDEMGKMDSRTTYRDLWLSLEKAYAPHSTSRVYTLKTQLMRTETHGDKTSDAYLNHAQEYADALVAIDEPVKNNDLVILAVSGLHEEYNSLKTTITARQSSTAFSELYALLSDHDYMLRKTRAPAPSITSFFAANYVVGSPSKPEACQVQLSELIA